MCGHPGCGKAFAHPSNRRAHERTHRGEKPYACHYPGCGKAFAHSTTLREHQDVHEGRKTHVCTWVVGPAGQTCGASFARVSNFGRHKRKVHGGAAANATSANAHASASANASACRKVAAAPAEEGSQA